MNPIVNAIAITNGIIGTIIGALLIIPAVMAFADPKLKPSMVMIGLSGFSAIPCATL